MAAHTGFTTDVTRRLPRNPVEYIILVNVIRGMGDSSCNLLMGEAKTCSVFVTSLS